MMSFQNNTNTNKHHPFNGLRTWNLVPISPTGNGWRYRRPPSSGYGAGGSCWLLVLLAAMMVNGETFFEAAFQGECRRSSPCQQLCFDLHDGTFECACHDGFHLDVNGYSCIKSNRSDHNGSPPPPPPLPMPFSSSGQKSGHHRSSAPILTYSLPPPSASTSLSSSSSLLLPQSSSKAVPKSPSPESSHSSSFSTGPALDGGDDGGPSLYSCTDIECEAGGVCIEMPAIRSWSSPPSSVTAKANNDGRVRCRCPLGRGGQFCEKIVEVKQPRFMGTSYLALPTLRNAHRSLKISVEFKPESFDGVLLYSGQETNLDGDFIAIILTEGFVEFRFDCGMGVGRIRSDVPVILNAWNAVDIYRDGRNAWMQVNQGPQLFGHSKGLFSRITFRLETFLGGSPNISQIAERITVTKGLIGCVRSLKINGRDYDLNNDTIDGIDIDQCNSDACNHVTCLNGGHCVDSDQDQDDEDRGRRRRRRSTPSQHLNRQPKCICPLGYTGEYCETQTEFSLPSFNGSSYLQFIGLGDRETMYSEIFMVIKPSRPDGLFLYNGQRMDRTGDFISLNLIDGYVEFRFDLGSGAAIIRSPERISMKEWHSIYASRTGREGMLRVDDQPAAIGLSLGGFVQLSLPLNLYVGGVPALRDIHHNVAVTQLYYGCIQRLAINRHQYSLADDVLSGVNIDNCQHLCHQPQQQQLTATAKTTTGPCQNDGICQPWNHHYRCHCLNNKFVGQHCEQGSSNISYPMFYGNSFLKYTDQKLLNRIRGYKTIIHLNLRAFSSSGLILWLGEPIRRTAGDYFTIGLNDGHVVVDINLGSGPSRFRDNRTRIDDGQWHQLDVVRIGRQCLVRVDQQPAMAVVRGQIRGSKSQLDVPSALYLGGLEDTVMATDNRYDKGFIGCISNMTLDQNLYVADLLGQSDRGINIRTCI